MPPDHLEARGSTLALRLSFLQPADRYGHMLALVNSDGAVLPLLATVEGIPSDDWPPSPPLQSLSFHTLPDGRQAALLVGMAGTSHWSASIEPAVSEPMLLFDIACRHSSQAPRLGSRYQRVAAPLHDQLQISSENAQLREQDGLIVIEPNSMAMTTTRWQYTISLKPKT